MTADQWAADWESRILDRLKMPPDQFRPAGSMKPSLFASNDSWNATRIATSLHPDWRDEFATFTLAVEEQCEPRGWEMMLWWGRRPVTEQLCIYRQGRTMPGKIVTKTFVGNHPFGLAADWARWVNGQPVFKLPSFWARDVLPLAAECGLSSLYLTAGFDLPHIEVPKKYHPEWVSQFSDEMRRSFPGL